MIVTVSIIDETGSYAAYNDLLVRNAIAGFEAWMPFLVDTGAAISISLRIAAELPAGATGGSGAEFQFPRSDGTILSPPGAGFELRTGLDPMEDRPDILISVRARALIQCYHINPLDGSPIPPDKLDLVSILAHEIGHGLGFLGYSDKQGQLAGAIRTPFDELIVFKDGAPYFVGPNAQAIYGGPVPLTPRNHFHVGTWEGEGADLKYAVMYGHGFTAGKSWGVSELDAAMLSDVGVPTIFGDRLSGTHFNETMFGGGGNDSIAAAEGDDVLDGGEGLDVLRGGTGRDQLRGGPAFDDMHGNQGDDVLWGGEGDDWVVGGQDSDLLYGEAGGDIVHGSMGDDTCHGGAGLDWGRGGQGQDRIVGGEGEDILFGDRGADTVTGGSGADTFGYFQGAGLDMITDFNPAEGDRLRIEGGATTRPRSWESTHTSISEAAIS